MFSLFNTKGKIFLSLAFLMATSFSVMAHDESQATIEATTLANQLATLLNNMDPVAIKQLEELLNEDPSISENNNEKESADQEPLLSPAKLTTVGVCLILAIVYWEYAAPALKEKFKGWETAVELPKAVVGAIILDEIKDFLKEIRFGIKNGINSAVITTKKVLASL